MEAFESFLPFLFLFYKERRARRHAATSCASNATPLPPLLEKKTNKIARKTTASGGGKKGGICERKKERCASNSDSLLRGENGIERIDYILLVQDNVKTTKAKGMDGKIMTRK